MKKLAFADGDVFEIFLKKRSYSYCRVIGRNSYGPLFELFREKFSVQQNIEALKEDNLTRIKVVFINIYSLKDKNKARFVGNLPLSSEAKKHPPFFKGDPYSFWIVFTDNGPERISPDKVSYEQMLKKGYIDYTIYATEYVVDFYLKNTPLAFKPHLTSFAKKQVQKEGKRGEK